MMMRVIALVVVLAAASAAAAAADPIVPAVAADAPASPATAAAPAAAMPPAAAPVLKSRKIAPPVRRPKVAADVCLASIANCNRCAYRAKDGKDAALFCLGCVRNYRLVTASNSCAYDPKCAAGTSWDAAGQGCAACGYGFWCAASTAGATATRAACPAGTGTKAAYSRTPSDCQAVEGFGWVAATVAAGAVAPCPAGTFNPLRFTRVPAPDRLAAAATLGMPFGCRACPSGLTTAAAGATAAADCQAPAGYYYSGGKALPCPLGAWKAEFGQSACTACPEGLTTAAVASTSATACSITLPGFGVAANGTAYACSVASYAGGGAVYTPGVDAPCSACPPGTETDEPGAASRDDCLAPPGWGWDEAAQAAAPCAVGYYKFGSNRDACVACGDNITTAGEGSPTSDDCLVPPGHGAGLFGDGRWAAWPCPADTYGWAAAVPGLAPVACIDCLEFTTTNGSVGLASEEACLPLPGYGFRSDDGVGVDICDRGEWSPGYARVSCTPCPPLRSTARAGATSADECGIMEGYTSDGAGGAQPCAAGFYKDDVGLHACAPCGNGTTTQGGATGAASRAECDACRPGFGTAATTLSQTEQTEPACAVCAPGTFAPGGTALEPCQPCGAGLTSPPGATSADDCVPELAPVGAAGGAAYDTLPMAAEALTAAQPAAATYNECLARCKAAAGAADGCQYAEWRSSGDGGDGSSGPRCLLRLGGLAPPAAPLAADGAAKVLLQVSARAYVAYAAHATDFASLGADYGAPPLPTAAGALAACDADARCAGAKYSPLGGDRGEWRLFAGALGTAATGQKRASGLAINPWVPPPTP